MTARKLILSLLFFSKSLYGLLITNAPIFLSQLSPILYHEACFSDRACLQRSTDGILYVTCNACRNRTGEPLDLNQCLVTKGSKRVVEFNQDCSLLGGFCASVREENRFVCVPAVPIDNVWWPEAVPSPSQKCQKKCGIDRAYFKSWNSTGGYEKTCLCNTVAEENVNVNLPSILNDSVIHLLLYRKPFPFCYFEHCNFVVNYGSRFWRANFTSDFRQIKKRSTSLVIGFKRNSDVSGDGKNCSTVSNLPFMFVYGDGNDDLCLDKDSYLFLHPEHLPTFYYKRKANVFERT